MTWPASSIMTHLWKDRLKLIFLPNYRVSLAERIFPASNLSEQISTAGKEASGTGNMKFALNGALTIGTLDGANIEIKDAVGDDNIFIFGLNAWEVAERKAAGYNPWEPYGRSYELRRVLERIGSGFFSEEDRDRYRPIVDALLQGGDDYMVLADFEPYMACQEKVDECYGTPFGLDGKVHFKCGPHGVLFQRSHHQRICPGYLECEPCPLMSILFRHRVNDRRK